MKNHKLLLALAGTFALTGTAFAQTFVNWTAAGDGDFNTAANWDSASVPGSGDQARWASGITLTSSVNQTTQIRHGLTGTASARGGFIIDGGTFTVQTELGLGWNNAGDYTVTGTSTSLIVNGDMLIRGNGLNGLSTVFNVADGASVQVGNRLRVRDGTGTERAYTHSINISGGSSFSAAGDFLSAGGRAWGYAYNIEDNNLTISLSGIASTFAVNGDHVSLLSSMIESDHLVVGGAYNLDFDTTTSGWTTLTVIPEPSTYAAIFGLTVLGVALIRRRSRKS